MRPICKHQTHLEQDAYDAIDAQETLVCWTDKLVWFVCPKNHVWCMKEEGVERRCLCDIWANKIVQCG